MPKEKSEFEQQFKTGRAAVLRGERVPDWQRALVTQQEQQQAGQGATQGPQPTQSIRTVQTGAQSSMTTALMTQAGPQQVCPLPLSDT
jgi:cell division protein FtsN